MFRLRECFHAVPVALWAAEACAWGQRIDDNTLMYGSA